MLKKSLILSSAACMTLTTGCASILSDSQYPVVVNSSPSEAKFVVSDQNGHQVHSGVTPATVILPAGDGFFDGQTYTIEFDKDGYDPIKTILDSEMDGWYVGNILFGGLIGLLIVDPATGAMWKLPGSVFVSLAQTAAPAAPATTPETVPAADATTETSSIGTLRVIALEDVPLELRGKLVRVN